MQSPCSRTINFDPSVALAVVGLTARPAERDSLAALFGSCRGRADCRYERANERASEASRRGDTTQREAVGPTVDRAMVQCATSPTRREGGRARTHARTYARMYVRESAHASSTRTCIVRQVIRVRGHESVRES